MDFLLRQKQLFDRARSSEIFGTLAYEPERCMFLDEGDDDHGYVSSCWICHPLPGASEENVRSLQSSLSNDIPNETIITVNLVSSTYVTQVLNLYHTARRDAMTDLSNPSKAALIREITESRLELLKSGTQTPLDNDSKVLLKDKYVVVTIKYETGKEPTEADLDRLKPFSIQLEQTLNSLNMFPLVVDNEYYLLLMRSLLYPGKKPTSRLDPHKTLNEQIFDYDTNIEVARDHVKVGDVHFCTLSVQQFPSVTALPVMSELLGDPRGSSNQIASDFMITTHIYFPDPHKAKQKIDKQARNIRVQNLGKIGRLVPKIGLKDENYNELVTAIETGGRPVKVWTNLLVADENLENLHRRASNARNFYEVRGFRLSLDRTVQAPIMQQQFPCAITPSAVAFSFRFNTMTTREAAHLLPIVSDWKGNGTGANNIFYSRRGQVILFDPFDTDTNMNTCIFGESGSGKSVLCNDIAASVWARGGIVRIIDSGRSYEKLTEQIGGEFIEFTPDKNIIINPFTDVIDIDEVLPNLCLILEQMAAPKSGLSDFQSSELQRLTKEAFMKYGNRLNITALSEYIISRGREEGKKEVREMGEQLFPFTRHGPFGRYFDGDANLSMSGDWSVLELDDLSDMKELRTIVLLMLIMKLNKDFYMGDKNVKKILICDEYWKFLLDKDIGSERIQKFLVGAFRLFRKYNCAVTVATQAVTDITTDGDSPLLGNAANIIVMKQKRESVDALQKNSVLSLDEQTFEHLRNISRKGTEYSDLFIYTGGRGYGVARFVIDRFTALLYSTYPPEVDAIKKLRAQGMTVQEAIKHIIETEQRQANVA